jgi:NAD(P)H dehydrogenase (quinone)
LLGRCSFEVPAMKHVVVICHPRRKSFTQTIGRHYAQALEALGHDVAVRDLYRLHFDPVLGERELPDAEKRLVPGAVRREQRQLAEAGAVAFFYPLWWAFMPAMMKGYIDRVLSSGFAYDIKNDRMVGRLSGKKAIIFTSSGADMAYLRRSKQWRSMRLLEEDNILSLCGVELLGHVHFASVVPDLPKRSVEKHLAMVTEVVQKHWGGVPAAQG